MISASVMKKIGLFAGGVAFGTAGVKILSSSDAKKVYTHTVAAALRARESVLGTATAVQENVEDILAEARAINAERECPRYVSEEEGVMQEGGAMQEETGGAQEEQG